MKIYILAAFLLMSGCSDKPEQATSKQPPAQVQSTAAQSAVAQPIKTPEEDTTEEETAQPKKLPFKAPGISQAGASKAAKTAAFLKRLDELLQAYRPELLALPDDGIFQCFTDHELTRNKDLKTFAEDLKSQIRETRETNERLERTFFETTLPLNARIDYAWATRRAKGRKGVYRYSNTSSPSRPVLMQLMEMHSVDTPKRLFCVVMNMYKQTQNTENLVTCVTPDSSESRFRLSLTTGELEVHPGDLISVPLTEMRLYDEAALVRVNANWVARAVTERVVVEEKSQGECAQQRSEIYALLAQKEAEAEAAARKTNVKERKKKRRGARNRPPMAKPKPKAQPRPKPKKKKGGRSLF